MHEMLKERKYDELVISMIKCKITKSTVLKFYDDIAQRER